MSCADVAFHTVVPLPQMWLLTNSDSRVRYSFWPAVTYGPGRARDWDIYKNDIRFWIEGDKLRVMGDAKSNVMRDWSLFKSVVLDNLPRYFQDLNDCLETMRSTIVQHSTSKDSAKATHQGVIRILEDRLEGTFDETIDEEPVRKGPKMQVTTFKRKRVADADDSSGGGM
ncbi:hypothetical protein AX17_002042 [Amanita inopinata Kibby_2008]|nr:hypothetical protein AX17_002042 [Amanita inopinata Kibby_2008]